MESNWVPTKEKLEAELKASFQILYFKSHPDNFFRRLKFEKRPSHIGAILEWIYVTLLGINNAHAFVVLAQKK